MTSECRQTGEVEVWLQPICIALSVPLPFRCTSGKHPVSIAQETGWVSGSLCKARQIMLSPGFNSQTAQRSSELLYLLHYPDHLLNIEYNKNLRIYLSIIYFRTNS